MRMVRNKLASPRKKYSHQQTLSLGAARTAISEITRWPNYRPTSLHRLGPLAGRTEVAQIYYKDEATRFGLGSFKALGGAYAVARLLQKHLREAGGRAASMSELASGRYRTITQQLTVVTATDGNHGRSVAWGARTFGCNCTVVIHAGVSAGREEAIAALGARVIRIAGNYDSSVEEALRLSAAQGHELVADTSSPGHEETCIDVMQGYSVMVAETLDQIRESSALSPTHVFIQGGVGGLAAAVCAHLWESLGETCPAFVIVEPERADCLFQSAKSGEPTSASGDLNTVMAGLACGQVSMLAWPILRDCVEFFMTVTDDDAIEAMRILSDPSQAGSQIVAGESGGAGLAGFIVASRDADARKRLGIDASSRILVFGTEGATDPELYRQLMAISD